MVECCKFCRYQIQVQRMESAFAHLCRYFDNRCQLCCIWRKRKEEGMGGHDGVLQQGEYPMHSLQVFHRHLQEQGNAFHGHSCQLSFLTYHRRITTLNGAVTLLLLSSCKNKWFTSNEIESHFYPHCRRTEIQVTLYAQSQRNN